MRKRTNKKRYKRKNKTIKKSFIKLNCSPENKNKTYTCYSDKDLLKLRDMWNARHPDRPINSSDPKIIWHNLKEYYSTICNKESCWVRKMTKNTKTLLWVAGLGAVAYYFWMKNKKAQVAAPATASVNWTGDLDVPQYQNAAGVPRFGKPARYPNSMNELGNKLTGL